MDIGELAFLLVALLLLAFTLGAAVAWRLEGRRPLVEPLWLMVTRNVSAVVLAVYIVTNVERPSSDVITIEPLWWNLMSAVIVVGPLLVFAIELRHRFEKRRA